MTLVLCCLLGVHLLELLIYTPRLWPWRELTAGMLIALNAGLIGWLLGSNRHWPAWLLTGVLLYRLFNLVRFASGNASERQLRTGALRTALWLLLAEILAFGAGVSLDLSLIGLAVVQFGIACIFLASTLRHLRTMRFASDELHTADRDLPGLTICVPARNETAVMERCLQSLLAVDYPKLEILVLDDCSQDQTSQIVRAFAHDGVRFIKGVITPEGWLAKNWAYQQLYQEASGELLLFCGVDISLAPDSVRQLVAGLVTRQKTMLCTLPQNQLGISRLPSLIQPLRYAWELSLPRRWLHRPPVLSSCWLVRRDLIEQAGTFASVQRAISPESHFARRSLLQDDYGFVLGGGLGITSAKTMHDQWGTATRVKYPQLHRRPELVLLVTAVQLLGLLAIPLVAILAATAQLWLTCGLSVAAGIIALLCFGIIVNTTYGRIVWTGYLALPLALLVDCWMRHKSMYAYEFTEVIWKGRNVCLPVMQVIPKLPHLD